MAAIDKIYGSREQRRELKRFLMRHRKRVWLKYLYPARELKWVNGVAFVAMFPPSIDRWLWKHCKLPFVAARLEEQYRSKP